MFLGQESHVTGSDCEHAQAVQVFCFTVLTLPFTHSGLCMQVGGFVCLPLTSCAPASVKSMLITSSKLQLGSDALLSWPTWCSILFRTSSREAAVSSSRMVARARKPSRSRCARISSSKFISFTYWRKVKIVKMSLVSAELDHINNANCIQFWLQTPSKQQTPEQYRDHSSPKFIKNGLVVSEDHLRDGQMDRDEHSSIKSPDTQQRSASSIM